MFRVLSPYQPAGDQPQAIAGLVTGINGGERSQVLLGVTGSGKTFTVSKVIEQVQLPTLVIAHNKTLAAQLYQEFRDFFPDNAVSYFVSYYDYYQPEAYIASSDTYIEKEAQINDDIDKLRLAATTNLLSRPDCIVIASVSCIYNLGAPEDFLLHTMELVPGELIDRKTLITRLTDMQYEQVTGDIRRGSFRLRGERIQIWPASEDWAITLVAPDKIIESIKIIDPVTGDPWPHDEQRQRLERRLIVSPAKHNIASGDQSEGLAAIERDLAKRLAEMRSEGKILEAARLEQRTHFDLDRIREVGYVNGIENYSRYFDGRQVGDPPFTLLDYFQYNAQKFHGGRFLTVVDESHMTLPQIRGMHAGDRSRKETLVNFGFRLPSALDNRPLQFPEFQDRLDHTLFVSATPNEWEIKESNGHVIEQIVRPTGLTDPPITIRPTEGQVPDLLNELVLRKQKGQRALVTTLTKKMAEMLAEYLNDSERMNSLLEAHGFARSSELPKAQYLHSDVDTLDRTDILEALRMGEYDVVIGVNLLREGLDLPEVTLVAILDADQEGFLRSESALVQTMGRAARHVEGQVIMYADRVTGSMARAMSEIDRRRNIQIAYNLKHNITPLSINKPIREKLIERTAEQSTFLRESTTAYTSQQKVGTGQTIVTVAKNRQIILEKVDKDSLTPQDQARLARDLTKAMNQAAKNWEFELAAQIRDVINKLI